jgi:flagella basal body P-ring formation protein FlgA
MRASRGFRLLLTAAWAPLAAAAAQAPARSISTVGDTALENDVRRLAARQLQAAPEQVVIEWRSLPTSAHPVALHLTGPDAAGIWTIASDLVDVVTGWTARFRLGLEVPAPVAARRLPRGTVLNDSDIIVARVVNWGPVHTSPTSVRAGWITRRVIRPHEPLREPAVAPAPLVGAGQPVLLVRDTQGLRLTVTGVATHAASLGETIAVRLGPKRLITAVVTGPGQVTATDTTSTP